jgi:eukaryotic-like serine/threonine-protein kinase
MMSTETITTDPNWGSLQGTMLEGGYELTEMLGADPAAATFKLRVLGDYSRKALAKLFKVQGEAANEQLSLWEAAKSLAHPNLSSPQAIGRSRIDGSELIYVVLARPDENLAGVLRERALTNDEAAEVMLSLTRALEHLHARGFVHGCLSPEQVLAIGDSILLSTECLRRINTPPAVEIVKPKYLAPEQAGENVTPAADVWCLGATIFQALTQKECGADCAQRAEKLSGAFARVLPRCLDADPQTRCKLEEVTNLYKSAPAPIREAKPRPVAVSASTATRPSPNGRTAPTANTPPTARPKPIIVPPRPLPRDAEERKPRAWIYIAVAALAVLLFIWLARPRRRTVVEPAPPAPQTATRKAWPTQTLSPEGTNAAPKNTPAAPITRPQPQRTPPQPAARAANNASSGGVNGSVWRVVLYTYNHEADAQKMAQSINQKHAGLGAEVFAPKENVGPYLVVIGGKMNREEAVKLRRKAVGQGLPHDSYIQNFKK